MSVELVLMAFVLAFVVLFLFEHQLERAGEIADEIEERIITRSLAALITAGAVFVLLRRTDINLEKELLMVIIGAFSFEIATLIENELRLNEVI
nr:hypothetical protein [uncultured archaeon]